SLLSFIAQSFLCSRNDAVLADPLPQHFGDHDRAIGFLVVFQDRKDGSCDGDGRAVERMDESRPFLSGRLVADVEPPGLEIGAVGSAGHLTVFAFLSTAWYPSFQIVFPIRRPAEIARAGV